MKSSLQRSSRILSNSTRSNHHCIGSYNSDTNRSSAMNTATDSSLRTLSSVLLKTVALRLAVITSYGHLASLQRLPATTFVLLPRMLLIILAPPVIVVEYLYRYLLCIRCIFFERFYSQGIEVEIIYPCTKDECGVMKLQRIRQPRPSKKMRWSWKYSLMVVAGLHVNRQTHCARGKCTADEMVDIAQVPLARIKHTAEDWTLASFLVSFSRVFVILVAMAQAIASLVLIIRRRPLEGATLLLDSSNGLYAVIGILCAWNSLLIHFVGGAWEVLDRETGKPEPYLQREKQLLEIQKLSNLVFEHLARLFFGFVPVLLFEAQFYERTGNVPRLVEKGSRLSYPPLPSYPYILTWIIIYMLGGCFIVFGIPRSRNGSVNRQSHWTTSFGFGRSIGRWLRLAFILPFFGSWMGHVVEMASLSGSGSSLQLAATMWQWYDPWSDVLFVY